MKKIIIISFFAIFFQCNQNPHPTGKKDKKEQKITELLTIRDSLNTAWNKMISADDAKINDIKRLLTEISYVPKHNLFLLDSLHELHSKLKNKRYSQLSMKNSQQIDMYDMATDTLIKKTYLLVKSTPEIDKYANVIQLIQDITAADNEVVLHRVKYDSWVRIYNQYFKENKNDILAKSSLDTLQENYYLFSITE